MFRSWRITTAMVVLTLRFFARQTARGGTYEARIINFAFTLSALLPIKPCRAITRATGKQTLRFGDLRRANGLFKEARTTAIFPYRSGNWATFPRRVIMTATVVRTRRSFVLRPQIGLSSKQPPEPAFCNSDFQRINPCRARLFRKNRLLKSKT